MATIQPTFSKIQVEPIHQQLSSIIQIPEGYEKGWLAYKIVSLSPEAGKIDGREVHSFKIGDIVIANKNHVIYYKFKDIPFYMVEDNKIAAILKDS